MTGAESASALLSARGLSVFRGERQVVRGVSLELAAGEVVALLGPNGAGKSTLLDALSGGLEPSTGGVDLRGRVAVAMQSPDLARRTVLANVELALGWWGMPRGPDRRARAWAALELMGVSHLAARPALSISGGERRRVHIARALAVEPDVLLLDEPFAGLDGEARARLLEDSVLALREPERATLVVVHDRAEAWALADRILILMDGVLVAEGSPRKLLGSPPTATVARFLGFDGELRQGGSVLLTRPAHVRLDPTGPLHATVARAIPLEDGVRLELDLSGDGFLYAVAPWPPPELGSTIGIRIDGGVRFQS